MKVLILTDGLNWIVDRITNTIIEKMPDVDFIRMKYPTISTDEFIKISEVVDLVHYQNWDIKYHLHRLHDIKTPFLYTFRSHRYPSYAIDVSRWATKTMVINKQLKEEIPWSVYIPDGIFDQFYSYKQFTVGYAGVPDDYKGYTMINEACNELGCTFRHAYGIPPEDMPDFYRSIDLYVCASVAEGHSTPVMECMAMNKPVITPPVGVPAGLNVHLYFRNKQSLKEAISKFYTRPQVEEFRWDNIIPNLKSLYLETIKEHDSKRKI